MVYKDINDKLTEFETEIAHGNYMIYITQIMN